MLYVDDRLGFKDGKPYPEEFSIPLEKLGLECDIRRLPSADFAFEGRGIGGAPLLIGVEHKKMGDLVQSMTTNRLQEQIEKQVLKFDRSWLIVEGEWDYNDEGRVVRWVGKKKKPLHGSPPAAELLQRLLTIYTRADISVWPSPSRRETLIFLLALYRWWTDKDLDEHKSHLGVKSPDVDLGLRIPLSDFRRSIQTWLPDIGFAASKSVEERCWDDQLNRGSFRKLSFLTLDDWANLEIMDRKGKLKRLGMSRAERIVEALK